MAKEKGWMKLYRDVQDHWLWRDKPFSKGQAWIDLIILANHKDNKIPYKGEVVVCKRGDVNLSIRSLAERWGWGWRRAKEFIILLEKDGMVLLNSTKHRTTITIVNYGKYQDYSSTNDTTNSTTNAEQTAQQRKNKQHITKNDKNDKNDKERKEKDLPTASDSDDDEGWMTGEELMKMWEEQKKHE